MSHLSEVVRHKPQPRSVGLSATTAYGDAALAGEEKNVQSAVESLRRVTLNRAAFSIGQLIAGGEVAEEEARSRLTAAALMTGLPVREIASTIRGAFKDAAKRPRSAPDTRRRIPKRKTPLPSSLESFIDIASERETFSDEWALATVLARLSKSGQEIELARNVGSLDHLDTELAKHLAKMIRGVALLHFAQPGRRKDIDGKVIRQGLTPRWSEDLERWVESDEMEIAVSSVLAVVV